MQDRDDLTHVSMTAAWAIVHVLHRQGLRDVFGRASGKLSPLFKALSARADMRFTGVAAATGGSAYTLAKPGRVGSV